MNADGQEDDERREHREDDPAGQNPESGQDGEQAARPETPAPEEYIEQPTEELFALEARLKEGEAPELDPVFRAALLESAESAIGEPGDRPESPELSPGEGQSGDDVEPAGPQPEEQPAAAGTAAGDDHPETGEEPYTGEEPVTGTHEWEAPSETDITAEQTAVLQATARNEVHEAIDFSRRTGKAWDPPRPPTGGDFEPPAKRPRYWWRFLLATIVIIGSFGTATQASVMNVVNEIAEGIEDESFKKSLEDVLPKNTSGPQTIAIIGSDARTGGGAPADDPGRSDTTILLRLDPDSEQIAMFSIPRDLRVEIPGHGMDKFNAAYSYGGTKLTLRTVKHVTGLEVNHVVNVDFQGFADVIDAIGCVFVDVDRRYFNDNSTVSFAEQYATIDIEAGYQKLCGYDALDFARYRHTDTDLVRSARQQDLMGEVRNRLSFGEIIKRQKELIEAFSDNTRSDISGTDEVLQLLRLLFDSRGANVTEISFPSTFTMRDGVSYVEATPEEIENAVNQFLGFEDQTGPVGDLQEGNGASRKAGKNSRNARKAAKRKKARKKKQQQKKSTSDIPAKDEDGLVDMSTSGLEAAQLIDQEIARNDFPVFYPKRLPEGSVYSDGSRKYHLRDPDKNPYAAYRLVMAFQSEGLHYFGLQGIRGWTDPPILEAPHEELEMSGRDFKVYPEGDRIRLISWTDGSSVYWISNSLLLTLDNQQMLGMARSTRAFTPNQ